jgi:hypothetical protein
MIATKEAICDNVSEMIDAKVELLDKKMLDLLLDATNW